jgi:outer membrane protein assembly factor BamA
VSGQAAWFKSLLGGVLGLNYRIGAIYPYDLAAQVPVPIAERFYSGGSSTGRGFATDLLGIPRITVDYNTQAVPIVDRTEPSTEPGTCAEQFPDQPSDFNLALFDCTAGPRIIGGNGFMAASAEFRYPILGNLGISVFYDLAQVWPTPGTISFKIEGETGLRQSIGAGLHYMTPVGPLRLEYARPIDLRTIRFQATSTLDAAGEPCDPSPCILVRDATVKETGRIFLSIGYPF